MVCNKFMFHLEKLILICTVYNNNSQKKTDFKKPKAYNLWHLCVNHAQSKLEEARLYFEYSKCLTFH